MQTINIHDAKTQLSRYVDQAATGDEIIIARAGKPIARLAPLAIKPTRQLGLGKGKFAMPENFDALHQADIQHMFEGS